MIYCTRVPGDEHKHTIHKARRIHLTPRSARAGAMDAISTAKSLDNSDLAAGSLNLDSFRYWFEFGAPCWCFWWGLCGCRLLCVQRLFQMACVRVGSSRHIRIATMDAKDSLS